MKFFNATLLLTFLSFLNYVELSSQTINPDHPLQPSRSVVEENHPVYRQIAHRVSPEFSSQFKNPERPDQPTQSVVHENQPVYRPIARKLSPGYVFQHQRNNNERYQAYHGVHHPEARRPCKTDFRYLEPGYGNRNL